MSAASRVSHGAGACRAPAAPAAGPRRTRRRAQPRCQGAKHTRVSAVAVEQEQEGLDYSHADAMEMTTGQLRSAFPLAAVVGQTAIKVRTGQQATQRAGRRTPPRAVHRRAPLALSRALLRSYASLRP